MAIYFLLSSGIFVILKPTSIFSRTIIHGKIKVDDEWVSDPWDARLVNEVGRKVLLDERTLWPSDGKFVTASMARTDYLQQNPDLIKKLAAAKVNESSG